MKYFCYVILVTGTQECTSMKYVCYIILVTVYLSINADLAIPLGWRVEILQTNVLKTFIVSLSTNAFGRQIH